MEGILGRRMYSAIPLRGFNRTPKANSLIIIALLLLVRIKIKNTREKWNSEVKKWHYQRKDHPVPEVNEFRAKLVNK